MNDKLEDTKPRPAVILPPEPASPPNSEPASTPPPPMHPMAPGRPPRPLRPEPSGPPRWLLWSVIGLFVLGMLTLAGGVLVFRFVLEPGQQERVIQAFPFMDAFMPPRPAPGDTLPTPQGGTGDDVSPEDLLSGLGLDASATPEAADDPTAEPTIETPEPTAVPTDAPTAEPTPDESPTDEGAAEAEEIAAAEPETVSETVQSVPQTIAVSLPKTVRLSGFNYQKQTWNNCGPANVTQALSFYGWQQDQAFAAQFLKPGGREDKNVSPEEMVAFVNEQSAVRALTRMGGTVDLVRALLANNFPVVIETGFMPEAYDWLGHYRTLVGYDDNQGLFYILDTFLEGVNPGSGVLESFRSVDADWKQFNRTFVVIYEPQREETLAQILGSYMDERYAAEQALAQATAEATANTTDGHAWFNMGTSLVALGNYERAALAYDRARMAGVPWRMTWYQFGPFEAYYGAGRFSEVLSLVNSNLGNGAEYVEETYYWQGRALEAQGDSAGAASAYRSALRRNPQYAMARAALDGLGL